MNSTTQTNIQNPLSEMITDNKNIMFVSPDNSVETDSILSKKYIIKIDDVVSRVSKNLKPYYMGTISLMDCISGEVKEYQRILVNSNAGVILPFTDFCVCKAISVRSDRVYIQETLIVKTEKIPLSMFINWTSILDKFVPNWITNTIKLLEAAEKFVDTLYQSLGIDLDDKQKSFLIESLEYFIKNLNKEGIVVEANIVFNL